MCICICIYICICMHMCMWMHRWLARLALNGSTASEGGRVVVGWPCRLAEFHRTQNLGADHFRYRPDHSCADFLAARKRGDGDVWHPVKLRGCFVEWLEDRGTPIDLIM